MIGNSGHAERGAAAVEFALVAMLLIGLLLAIVEGGRLFMMQASLSAAARDGARTLAITNDTGLAYGSADATFIFGSPTVVGTPGTCPDPPAPGSEATYRLSFPAGTMTGFFPGAFTITGQGVMRCGG